MSGSCSSSITQVATDDEKPAQRSRPSSETVVVDALDLKVEKDQTVDAGIPVVLVGNTSHGFKSALEMSNFRKWYLTSLSALAVFTATLSASAPSVLPLQTIFHTSSSVATLSTALFVLGFVVGPMVLAPWGERVGRRLSLVASFSFFTLCNLICTFTPSNQIAMLLVFRFLAGCASSSAMTNAATVISDVWLPSERGGPTGLFCTAGICGQAFGPFVGGCLSLTIDWPSNPLKWRTHFLFVTCFSAWTLLLMITSLPETYAPILMKRSLGLTAAAEKVTLKDNIKQFVSAGLGRPLLLLFCEPICCLVSIYVSLIYGLSFLTLKAWPLIFYNLYGLSLFHAMTSFLFICLGTGLGGIVGIYYNKRAIDRLAAGIVPEPEDRCEMGRISGPLMFIALMWAGWTARPDIHPIVPMLSGIPLGMAVNVCYIPFQNYLIEVYKEYAASSVAANVILRSICGAAFPLFATSMFDGMSIKWACTLLAICSLIITPLPFFFSVYGKRLREKSPFATSL